MNDDIFPTPPIPYTPIKQTCKASVSKEVLSTDLKLMEPERGTLASDVGCGHVHVRDYLGAINLWDAMIWSQFFKIIVGIINLDMNGSLCH